MFYGRHHNLVILVADYSCHKWPWICSVCRNHNSWLMTFHRYCSKSNMTAATSGVGTGYLSRARRCRFGIFKPFFLLPIYSLNIIPFTNVSFFFIIFRKSNCITINKTKTICSYLLHPYGCHFYLDTSIFRCKTSCTQSNDWNVK